MTEKPATTKCKAAPAKPSAAANKSATVKPVVAKPWKKNKKAKKTNGKAEAKVKVVRDSFTMPQTIT